MKKIALATAAVLTLTGAAFAESPTDSGADINVIAQQQKLDNVRTSSIGNEAPAVKVLAPANTIAEQNIYDVRTGHRDFGNR
ncbi:hypothetical protein [Mesorhizobium sp. 8]|uniref:hypothetical protein n=1 Tax=Mesorhizobium sp. 8 TaxID=2584466 RepID=UPI0011233D23|nr:hypothetical protein [Mesorhizobium sp. 8]QDC02012.1 hypothetical protein FGU64_17130 [Mesorhizobium sp. 8]